MGNSFRPLVLASDVEYAGIQSANSRYFIFLVLPLINLCYQTNNKSNKNVYIEFHDAVIA